MTYEQLTQDIKNLKLKKNRIIDESIILLKRNASKKKIYAYNLELERIEVQLAKKRAEKEKLLIEILSGYNY